MNVLSFVYGRNSIRSVIVDSLKIGNGNGLNINGIAEEILILRDCLSTAGVVEREGELSCQDSQKLAEAYVTCLPLAGSVGAGIKARLCTNGMDVPVGCNISYDFCA